MLLPDLFATAFEPLDLNVKPLAEVLKTGWRPFSAAGKTSTASLSYAQAPSNPISKEQRSVGERVSAYWQVRRLLEPSMTLKMGAIVEAQTHAEVLRTRMGMHFKASG